MERLLIENPPSDLELNFVREPLQYFLTAPMDGPNRKTGLIFNICGFGQRPDDVYFADKLAPYLSNKYNCYCVGVAYFGILVKFIGKLIALPKWKEALFNLYGLPPTDDLGEITKFLRAKGVAELSGEFPLISCFGGEYQSFGFLPALDHIAVLGDILRRYDINRKRLIILSTSCGGHIAGMMLKLMSNTFSTIIDNSGFVRTELPQLNNMEFGARHWFKHNGVRICRVEKTPWSVKDSSSQGFFKPEFAAIRDLTLQSHYRPGNTRVYGFHSALDELVPIEDKELHFETLQKFYDATLVRVERGDIDGKLFKEIGHGMGASLRGIFDLVAETDPLMERNQTETDFEMNTRLSLNCGAINYAFSFSDDFSFKHALI